MAKRRDPYKNIAEDYDKLIGPREEVKFLLKLVKKSCPRARSILELGCGTGTLLKNFATTHAVSGLDYSSPMLKKARRVIPGGKFYQGDMTTFHIGRNFDLILCLFNSLNHLQSYAEWIKTFKQVRGHLAANGTFIFDINTPLALENFAADPFIIERAPGKFITTEYSIEPDKSFLMRASIFTKLKKNLYSLQESRIVERAYRTERITADLKRSFKKVRIVDPERSRPTSSSEVLYFVCQA